MMRLAKALENDYILRSGGADGADDAFFRGVTPELQQTRMQIFLPGDRFKRHKAGLQGCIDATRLPAWSRALETVDKYHPVPYRLSAFARKLMARNTMQVLGANLDDPVKFVACWTPGGALVGGTGQALRIADDHGIPTRNLGDPAVLENIGDFLRRHQVDQ